MQKLGLLVYLEDKASAGLKGISGAVGGLGKVAVGMGAAVGAGMVAAGVGIGKLAEAAAPIEAVKNTFGELNESIGATSKEMTTRLRLATRGMVRDVDLMGAANKFMSMGLADSTEEVAALSEMATQLGMAMGGTATESMENFALMLANQSIPRLDSFGISSSAVRERIDELMASTEGLTREQAFMQAVMEEGGVAMERVGEQGGGLSGTLSRLKTTFGNVKDGILVDLAPALNSLLTPLADIAEEYGPKVIEWAGGVANWLGENLPGIISDFGEKVAGAWDTVKSAAETLLSDPRVQAAGTVIGDIVNAVKAAAGDDWETAVENLQAAGVAFAGGILGGDVEDAKEVSDTIGSIAENFGLLGTNFETSMGIIDKALAKSDGEGNAGLGLFKWLLEEIDQFVQDVNDGLIASALYIADWAYIIEGFEAGGAGEVWKRIGEKWADATDGISRDTEVALVKMADKTDEMAVHVKGSYGILSKDVLSEVGDINDGVVGETDEMAVHVKGSYGTLSEDVGHSIIPDMMATIVGEFAELAKDAVGAIDFEKFKQAGKDIIGGIKGGIRDNWGSFIDWVLSKMGDILDAIKGFFGIHSDSTVMAGIGANLAGGLLGGWEANMPNLNFTVKGSASGGAIIVHNHFGKDSVRSDKDVFDLANQIERSVRLRGGAVVIA